MADYRGVIRFIGENEDFAIVEQTELIGGTPSDFLQGLRFVKSDFSGKAREDSIDYAYDADAALKDGYYITIE